MQRTKNILFNICFAINCLLVFLLLLDSRLEIPPAVQVIGRMHPLLLHFPISLLILFVFYSLFSNKNNNANEQTKNIGDWLLLITAFTSSITALMGLLLSKENGYDADALQWHKWSGVSVAIITTLWFAYREKIKSINWLNTSTALLSLVIIVFTGHLGGEITHGENYLLSPILPETQQQTVLIEDATVYKDMVQPILKTKCMSCHNSKKAKGELVMETEALLLKGGKNGKLWDSTAADFGLMLSRIHLPMEAKKHMPPTGKPQLTELEIQILNLWIKSGADFNIKVASLNPSDSLRLIANSIFNTIETDDYDFDAADESKIKNLNSNYLLVEPISNGSPAVTASFFSAKFFSPEKLNALLTVKEQLISLNLNKTPTTDEQLKTIGQLIELRKLNLAFTNITGKTLGELNKLQELRQLSLSGTSIKKDDVLKLSALKKLTHVYVWSTPLTDADIADLKSKMKNVEFEKGFKGDTTILKLTPPILLNEEQIINTPVNLNLKHYINGVTIHYTLDGTEPDSIIAETYNNNIVLTHNVTVKAKAYKQGWYSSDVMEKYFFSSKYKPDSIIHLQPADVQYRGDGAKTLSDLVTGEATNFKNGKWVGFRENKMETLFLFDSIINVKSVTLNSLVDVGSYIMPPVYIEVWGGTNKNNLKLLKRISPEQPTKLQSPFTKAFELSFTAANIKSLKIISMPVPKLPAWHPGKGDKGWFFIDEVFIN
ncbi:MAG TPA: FN3 associated domain-containing protein [Bacteroidia bacterium]|nr:FN3 associated domain-containing protein [Bacteroidia bacterium]